MPFGALCFKIGERLAKKQDGTFLKTVAYITPLLIWISGVLIIDSLL
jgi:hypothetical protein